MSRKSKQRLREPFLEGEQNIPENVMLQFSGMGPRCPTCFLFFSVFPSVALARSRGKRRSEAPSSFLFHSQFLSPRAHAAVLSFLVQYSPLRSSFLRPPLSRSSHNRVGVSYISSSALPSRLFGPVPRFGGREAVLIKTSEVSDRCSGHVDGHALFLNAPLSPSFPPFFLSFFLLVLLPRLIEQPSLYTDGPNWRPKKTAQFVRNVLDALVCSSRWSFVLPISNSRLRCLVPVETDNGTCPTCSIKHTLGNQVCYL